MCTQQLCSSRGEGAGAQIGLLPRTRDARGDTWLAVTGDGGNGQDTSIQREGHTHLWLLSWSAVQFRRLPFSVIQGRVQNHIHSGHPVLPWMSEPQLLHLDLNVFPFSVAKADVHCTSEGPQSRPLHSLKFKPWISQNDLPHTWIHGFSHHFPFWLQTFQ